MGLGRVNPHNHERDFLHDGAGAASFRGAPMPCRRCTAKSRAPCGRACSAASRKTKCPSATSPTACTSRPGWRRRCAGSTTAISAPDWQQRSGEAEHLGRHRERRRRRALGDAPQTLKSQLIEFVRRRAVRQAERRGESAEELHRLERRAEPGRADHRLRAPLRHLQARQPDPDATSSGWLRMVNDPKRPVQFVFAGKAHPHDEPGKRVLQQIARADARPAVSPASSSSSRTTTSTSAATWCRASTSG